MLVDEGLDAWADGEGKNARERVGFTGVLVPADKLWAGQLRDISDALPLDLRRPFGQSAFALMALRALASAAHRRVHGPWGEHGHNRAMLSRKDEAELCQLVADSWAVPQAVGTLASLRDLTRTHVTALSQLGKAVARPRRRESAQAALENSALLDLEFYSAASLFVGLFNDRIEKPGALWAFLIDELEFLPRGTRSQIRSAVQGNDPSLVFKVSLAPYRDVTGDLRQPLRGMPFADFDPVPLGRWQREQEDPFIERLFEQSVHQHRTDAGEDSGGVDRTISARALLGSGGFEPPGRESYKTGGENWTLIRELAEFDESFADYLAKLGVDVNELDTITRGQYDRLRSAMPIVRLRHEYWKADEHGGRQKRSRKSLLALYAGRESVLAMSEGNPRWIKALAFALINRWDGSAQPIPPDRQLRAVEEVADQYLEYLRAVDVDHQMDDLYDGTDVEMPSEIEPVPYPLIVEIGDHFQSVVHGDYFYPEPRLGFWDDTDDPMTTGVLQALMFLGAVVVDGEVEGRQRDRLRLAHLFAPHFRLPLRTTKAVSLKALLTGDIEPQPETDGEEPLDPQLELLPEQGSQDGTL